MTRYILMAVLLVTAVAGPSVLPRAAPAQVVQDPDVPPAVREAVRQGRYWRASRILGEHLLAAPDTSPETILLASRLSAEWGDWSSVSRLLEGRRWLDEVGGGAGWRLLGQSRIEQGRPREGSEALGNYLRAGDPGDRDEAVAQLQRGLALAAAGETDASLEAFDSAAATIPWLSDWAALLAAEAAAAAGDTAEVRTRLAAAGQPLASARGWRLRLDAARAAGDNLAAREAALAAAREAGSASDRATAWSILGDLRLEGGDTVRAVEAYRSALNGAPGSIGAVDAARHLSELSPTPAEWRTIGNVYLRHGNQARAIAAFERYLARDAGTPAERASVRLGLGEALFNAGRYAEAERLLVRLSGDDVPGRIGAQALYIAGRARYRQGRSTEGKAAFLALADRFPGEDATARGLYLLADLEHDDLEIEDARRHYRAAANAAPAANHAGLALMRLGGLEYLDGDYEDAAGVFEEYRRLHPDGRRIEQATYWAAMAYRRLGRDEEAGALLRSLRARDPLSFYGTRAAEVLGQPVLDVPMEPSPARDAALDSMVENGLRRVDVLAELDRRGDVVHEVERLREHFDQRDGGAYALAEALNQRGYTLTAISMGWDLQRREGAWNRRLLEMIYPLPFRDMLAAEAREQGVDPYLVAAVIRRESAFNPEVVSHAGAIGLMQIMPATGRGLARGAGMRGFDIEMLKEPDINLHLGTRYLRSLIDRFDDQLPLVLSAYNAGPNRAVRWRRLPEARDMELFPERVPYAETRNYIRYVLQYRALYRALYPDLGGTATGADGGDGARSDRRDGATDG